MPLTQEHASDFEMLLWFGALIPCQKPKWHQCLSIYVKCTSVKTVQNARCNTLPSSALSAAKFQCKVKGQAQTLSRGGTVCYYVWDGG